MCVCVFTRPGGGKDRITPTAPHAIILLLSSELYHVLNTRYGISDHAEASVRNLMYLHGPTSHCHHQSALLFKGIKAGGALNFWTVKKPTHTVTGSKTSDTQQFVSQHAPAPGETAICPACTLSHGLVHKSCLQTSRRSGDSTRPSATSRVLLSDGPSHLTEGRALLREQEGLQWASDWFIYGLIVTQTDLKMTSTWELKTPDLTWLQTRWLKWLVFLYFMTHLIYISYFALCHYSYLIYINDSKYNSLSLFLNIFNKLQIIWLLAR